MSSKLNPWRALRSLSVRTRPLRSCPEQQRIPTSVLARRGLSDDMTTRGPPSGSDNYDSIPPLPPSPPPPSQTQDQPEIFASNFLNADALAALEKTAAGGDQFGEVDEGLLFGAPVRPKKHEQLQDRYHPVVTQVTRLLMRDGKLSKAQRVCNGLLLCIHITNRRKRKKKSLFPMPTFIICSETRRRNKT